MQLSTALSGVFPDTKHLFVSVTGGGGKSSLISLMGRFFRKCGRSVVITTSTRIQDKSFFEWGADAVAYSLDSARGAAVPGSLVLYGKKSDTEGKLQAPATAELAALKECFDVVLCEADGSRHLPLKIHTSRDPVIMPFSDITVAVAGAWALGKSVGSVVFGCPPESAKRTVDASFLQDYLDDPEGLFKGMGPRGAAVINGIQDSSAAHVWKSLSWRKDVSVFYADISRDDCPCHILHS